MRPSQPERTCVGCQAKALQKDLVRLVADEAGRIKIDGSRRQPGRGAYLHVDRGCCAEMVKRGALARSLKRKVKIGPGDEEVVWKLVLENRGKR